MSTLVQQSYQAILTQQDINTALLEYNPEDSKRRKEFQEKIKTLTLNVL